MNINNEIGVMDCTLQHKKMDEFWLRIISGIFAIPFVIAVTYLGFPYFDILSLAVLLGMLREWSRLTTFSLFHPVCGAAFAQMLLFLYGQSLPLWLYISLNLLAVLLVFRFVGKTLPIKRAILFVGGCFYVCAAVAIMVFLSHKGAGHRAFVLWLFSIVWAGDIGAYFVGRLLKGPKLAPRISPNKTWSGLIGGLVCAYILGSLFNYYFDLTALLSLSFSGALLTLAISAHVGDLLESSVKRHFGVKDAGSFIPGHGGLLDRLDSLLLAALMCGLFLLMGWIQ
jgi:phosphatidate cytidylyltransferase